jgi:hypothetical protein
VNQASVPKSPFFSIVGAGLYYILRTALGRPQTRPSLIPALLTISILFTFIGVYPPWPPGYERETGKDPVVSLVKNPVGGNLGAWLHEKFGATLATRIVETTFISKSIRPRYLYLNLSYESKGDKKTAEKVKAEYVQIINKTRGSTPKNT